MCDIHYGVVHFVRELVLLENRLPGHPISSLWDSILSLRWWPLMLSLETWFISAHIYISLVWNIVSHYLALVKPVKSLIYLFVGLKESLALAGKIIVPVIQHVGIGCRKLWWPPADILGFFCGFLEVISWMWSSGVDGVNLVCPSWCYTSDYGGMFLVGSIWVNPYPNNSRRLGRREPFYFFFSLGFLQGCLVVVIS